VPKAVDLEWANVGIPTTKAAVRDLWSQKDLGELDHIRIGLAPHACVLYRVHPD